MESEQTSIRDENKTLLRAVTAHFPKTYNYAEKIVERLAKKEIVITKTQVYNCVGGDTYHAEIAQEISELGKEYLDKQRKLRSELQALNRELAEVTA